MELVFCGTQTDQSSSRKILSCIVELNILVSDIIIYVIFQVRKWWSLFTFNKPISKNLDSYLNYSSLLGLLFLVFLSVGYVALVKFI